jgi:acyl-CoA synthetase (AMP-forming)/AMP-acid ligase II
MLTHANLTAGVLASMTALPFGSATVELGILPFFHVAGMVCTLHSAVQEGRTLVLSRRFEPEFLLRTLQNYKIQAALLVPPLIIALVLSALRGMHRTEYSVLHASRPHRPFDAV